MAENKPVRFGQKLRGAVLIMVITVMFMLIILLLATLTVVSASKSRLYKSYEENQAYFSARSALDVFAQNMFNKEKGDIYIAYDTDGNERYYEFTVTNSDYTPGFSYTETSSPQAYKMSQACALQFDLYQLRSQEDMTSSSLFNTAVRSKAGQNNIRANLLKSDYDSIVTARGTFLQDKYTYSTAYTKRKPNPATDGNDMGEGKDYITYTVTMPNTADNTSTNYGKLYDGSDTATIVVEVLDREYNLGGQYAGTIEKWISDQLNAGNEQKVADFYGGASQTFTDGGTTVTITKEQLIDAILSGDRTKDSYRIKVTSTVQYMGVEGVASLIVDSYQSGAKSGGPGGALITRSNIAADNMNIVGGIITENAITWQNDNAVYVHPQYGNVSAAWSQVTRPKVSILKGTGYFVDGEMRIKSNEVKWKAETLATDTINPSQRPYIYVAEKFVVDGSGISIIAPQIATDGNPQPYEKVDLITNGFEFKTGGAFKYYGDIFCNGDFDVSNLSGNGMQIYGDVYIKGNLIVNYGADSNVNGIWHVDTTSGAVFCGSFPEATSKIHLDGDVIYNTTQVCSDLTGAPIVKESIDFSSFPAVGTVSKAHPKITIKLPNGADRTVPELFDSSADESAEKAALGDASKSFYDVANAATKTISGNGSSGSDGTVNVGGNTFYTYNFTGGEKVKLGNLENARLYFKGTGTIEVVCLHDMGNPWTKFFVQNDNEIIIDQNLTVKFYFPDVPTDLTNDYDPNVYNLNKLAIWPEHIRNAAKNGSTLYVGNGEHAIDSNNKPNIYYYLTKDAKVVMQNSGSFMCGYVYGPEANLVKCTAEETFNNLIYCCELNTDDGTTHHYDIPVTDHADATGIKLGFIGSVNVYNFTAGSNKGGIAYILDGTSKSIPKGKAPLSIASYEYTRGK